MFLLICRLLICCLDASGGPGGSEEHAFIDLDVLHPVCNKEC